MTASFLPMLAPSSSSTTALVATPAPAGVSLALILLLSLLVRKLWHLPFAPRHPKLSLSILLLLLPIPPPPRHVAARTLCFNAVIPRNRREALVLVVVVVVVVVVLVIERQLKFDAPVFSERIPH